MNKEAIFAYHEAGHVVVAIALGFSVHSVTIETDKFLATEEEAIIPGVLLRNHLKIGT